MGCGGSKKTEGNEPAKQEEAPPKKEESLNRPKNTEEAIYEAFQKVDTNNSGYLTKEEIKQALKELGEDDITDEQLDQCMDKVDKNEDDKISYKEFYNAWIAACKEISKREKLMTAFKNMDKDGSGRLSKDEVTAALKEIGAYEDNEQVEQMIKDADADGDGKVNYAEFVDIIEKESQQ
ncbi:calmodulin-like protein 5 isoform X2 [Ptychodera flava]|uniref:calmodulin-like protein 5 isoform X2 n=1 Tax=Ptychodera flava TaxID=63121 RepID=UPI00396A5716